MFEQLVKHESIGLLELQNENIFIKVMYHSAIGMNVRQRRSFVL
jgi:hypothetical protein